MIDASLHPALLEALKRNEIGEASPYMLSYARYGASGASFGVFQADTHTDPAALATLGAILHGAGVETAAARHILEVLSHPCPHGDPLSRSDARAANAALASSAGRAAVDGLDARLFHAVLTHLEACEAAADARGCAVDPLALLYMALWVNMTGAPVELCAWLRGAAAGDLPAPVCPRVSAAALDAYLQRTPYFRLHPANLAHLRASAAGAEAKLPTRRSAA